MTETQQRVLEEHLTHEQEEQAWVEWMMGQIAGKILNLPTLNLQQDQNAEDLTVIVTGFSRTTEPVAGSLTEEI